MKKLLFIFALFILAVSCDNEGLYYYQIDNLSSYNITIGFRPLNDYTKDYDSLVVITPNIVKNVWVVLSDNSGDIGDRFLTEHFDTFYIQINDTLAYERDIYNREFWEYIFHPRGRKGDSFYKLTIFNRHIEAID